MGYDRRALVGHNITGLIPDEDRSAASDFLLAGIGEHKELKGRLRLRRLDGSLESFALSTSPIFDDTGLPRETLAILRRIDGDASEGVFRTTTDQAAAESL